MLVPGDTRANASDSSSPVRSSRSDALRVAYTRTDEPQRNEARLRSSALLAQAEAVCAQLRQASLTNVDGLYASTEGRFALRHTHAALPERTSAPPQRIAEIRPSVRMQ